MWRDWMYETLRNSGFDSDIGKHDDLLNIYKSKKENQPSNLFDQMNLLNRIGFKDVDFFQIWDFCSVRWNKIIPKK